MNRKNVLKAIAIMERAKVADNLSMAHWQRVKGAKFAHTEEELNKCGNTACFAGYVAISKEFREDGGDMSFIGVPYYKGYRGAFAIKEWLEITPTLAERLVCQEKACPTKNTFYDKPWATVTAQDVIDKLQLILSGKLK